MNAGSLRAIVLAAGLSTRMGEAKPLLPLDGVPAVVRVALGYIEVGVEPIVVLGDRADQVAPLLAGSGVRHVVNHAFAAGMYSSIRCGVEALPGGTSAFFVHPVDCALVRPETLGLLARSVTAATAVVYPLRAGARGHPPLLAASLRDAVLAADPPGGLQELLAQAPGVAVDVPVDDPNVRLDMDDPAAYERLRRLAARERLPSATACRELLERLDVPAPVVAHSATVATVACRLGAALRAAGVCLDLRLLEAAALLHDIARAAATGATADHAAAGADAADAEGFPRVAAVVRHHMRLPGPPALVPGETEVLYLADKLTIGAEIADLPSKRRRAEARFAGDTAALEAALRRLDTAGVISGQVEALVGRPLALVIGGGSSKAVPGDAAR